MVDAHAAAVGFCSVMESVVAVICPGCKNETTEVIDSRGSVQKSLVRRRRHCPKCELRFSTYEQPMALADVDAEKRERLRGVLSEVDAAGVKIRALLKQVPKTKGWRRPKGV